MSGSGAPSVFLAFAAGFVSFISPCVLPLVPGYLSTVSGMTPDELRQPTRQQMRRVLVRAGLFVATFSLIFVLLGMTATGIGSFLFDNLDQLETVAGILIIALGAFFVLTLVIPALNRDWHPQGLMERVGRGGPIVAGAAFAIAWTPCVGPTLGAILGLAGVTGTVAEGGALLAVYSAGLAIPFIVSALAFNRATTVFAWMKRHYGAINLISGLLLIGMGVLVLTGELTRLNSEAQSLLNDIDADFYNF